MADWWRPWTDWMAGGWRTDEYGWWIGRFGLQRRVIHRDKAEIEMRVGWNIEEESWIGGMNGFLKWLRWCSFIGNEDASTACVIRINCSQLLRLISIDHEIELPEGFPFEIVDNPGDQAVVLKRELAGENIQVTVLMNLDVEGDFKENEEDGSEDDNNESSFQPTISLVVSIEKGEGPFLEFCCNLRDDGLQIESMVMKKRDAVDDQGAYQGPEFSDLDEKLQKAFHKYLEVRGIKGSLFGFLHEYMINKDEKEYLVWLKNMKEFIEK